MENSLESPVLDCPASAPHINGRHSLPHAFTKENAREMALRAKEARIKREEAGKTAIKQLAQVTPQCEIIAEEMKRIQGLISESDDADTIAKLSGALERQFKMWQVLSGTPNPGARKAGRNAKPAPIQPEPIPVTEPPKPGI